MRQIPQIFAIYDVRYINVQRNEANNGELAE